MIKRPLAGMTIALIAGISLYQLPPVLLLVTALLLLVIVLAMETAAIRNKLKLTKEDRHRYLWPVFLILGYAVMNKNVAPPQIESVYEEKAQVVLTGYIEDMNQTADSMKILLKDTVLDGIYQEPKLIVYLSIADKTAVDNIINNQNNTEDLSDLAIGNLVQITGTIHWPRKASNDGQFDEAKYYQSQKIHTIVYADMVKVMDPSISMMRHTLYTFRKRLTSQLFELLPEKEAGLLAAIMLGEKETLSDELKQLYQENGFAHIMAISGLHISLIGYGLYLFCKKVTLPVRLRCLLPSVILIAYGALVGSSVSAQRSILMFLLSMIAVVIGRSYDGLSAISLSAIIQLLMNPLCLFTAGFLFSYAAVLGILMIYPVLSEHLKCCQQSKVISSLLFSASIQLALLPLQCFFYYEFSLYSIIPNLILLPLCSIIVGNAMLACAFSFLSVTLGRFLIAVSYYLLQFFELILSLLARLPYHMILTGCPEKLQIAAYYTVLLISLLAIKKYHRWYCSFGVFLMIPLVFHYKDDYLKVTAMDIGQGDCIVIEQGGHTILVDGGSTDITKVYEYRIEPYLKYHRIQEADAVVVTHSDQDHICGIEDMIAASYPVKMLYVPDVTKSTKRIEELIVSANQQKIPVTKMSQGDSIHFDSLSFLCLNPSKDADGTDTNRDSVALWLTYGQFDLLLMADTTKEAEARMIACYGDELKKASIEGIKAGHHGSDYSTQKEWLDVVSCKFAILSYGKNNRYGHPGSNLLKRLDESSIAAYHTAVSGAISIQSDGQNWLIECYQRTTMKE